MQAETETMNVYFNDDILFAVAKGRGYMTKEATAKALAKEAGIPPNVMLRKIKTGRITFEDSYLFAGYFSMTPKEYCDTFLNGLFQVDENGHWVARVDNKERVREDPDLKARERRAKAKEAQRKALIMEVQRDLDRFG